MQVDLRSARARKAVLGQRIGDTGFKLLLLVAVVFGLAAAYLFVSGWGRFGYLSIAVGLMGVMLAGWYRFDLAHVPVRHPAKQLDDILAPALLATLHAPYTPRSVWDVVTKQWQGIFVTNMLLLHPPAIAQALSTTEADMAAMWQQALQLMQESGETELHAGTLATAIILLSPAAAPYLTHNKLARDDIQEVYGWLVRQIGYANHPRANFGGIGRDWATGFTPTLDRFGQNISRAIEAGGGYIRFVAHADLLDGLINNISQGTPVALSGPAGVGKSELVYALADRLIEGRTPSLRYYQIVSLNASAILSAAGSQLESLMLMLFGEAIAAGNIILYLDEAQLFFGAGTGAFNMSQLLLPVLKNRRLKIIASFTPGDWQHLRLNNESLAGNFAAITVNEPPAAAIMKVVEDSATILDHHSKVLVTYEAVREAYRLSGQYMQEDAYPGKAITLLDQATPYAANQVMTAETVQAALEKMRGVRVSRAAAPEAEMLLHLEDRIHQRMINQVQAVNVVASALRRGRAGVSNPKRPVGSFLFLGPTGVGKTELARSLAAVYFGDERQMIRLDMSEYQQPEDVARLLSPGGQGVSSLLLSIRQQPFSVVLLDEVEKAHPNILNLLLQILDEGQLTDAQGRPASFRSAIIIATSNAGAADITARIKAGGDLSAFERPLLDKLIAGGQFRPELINRFDEIVLFRPLKEPELLQVAQLMLGEVNRTLAPQNISVKLTPEALQRLVQAGYDPEFGARPMRRIIQKTVENAVAVKILGGQAQAGSVIALDVGDLSLSSNAAVADTPEASADSTPQQPPTNGSAPTTT